MVHTTHTSMYGRSMRLTGRHGPFRRQLAPDMPHRTASMSGIPGVHGGSTKKTKPPNGTKEETPPCFFTSHPG